MDGYLCLILHAHLPFVRHPEFPSYLEEDWLFEAITETYLPLLEVYENLWNDGVDFRVSMTLSPPLLNMFEDRLLRSRYVDHMQRLIELADAERERHAGPKSWLAELHANLFRKRLAQYERYHRDLTQAFARFVRLGRLEVLTCGATHGFLPLLQDSPEAVRAQIEVACQYHATLFGERPRGIWLPECGTYDGLDQILRDCGIRYFIGERHAIEHATPRPTDGVHAPIYTPAGVAVFARDPETSAQVWSADSGYPGHPDYREFYRDVGFDAPYEHVKAYIQPTGDRKMVGIKYQRITGKTENKELYDPVQAHRVATEHAGNFCFNRGHQLAAIREQIGRPGIVVAPYDAELFGHWWHEGPQFLDMVFRRMSDVPNVGMTTPSEYLRAHPEQQLAAPHFSSWGRNGYGDVWLSEDNEWAWPLIHDATRRMVDLANRVPDAFGLRKRALDQLARELLLLQSSDWTFIIETGTSVHYAETRIREHAARFGALADQVEADTVDPTLLYAIEARDTLFPDLDYRVYCR